MVFHRSLIDSKSSQDSRTLLNIRADRNNALVWMISTYFKFSSTYTNTSVTVSSAPITIGITVTFIFHSFFQFSYKGLFSLSFSFTLLSAGSGYSTIRQVLFCRRLSLGLVVWPRLHDPIVSKNPREFCVSHFLWTDRGLCLYHWFVWWNLNFLQNFQWVIIIILLLYIFVFFYNTFKWCCFFFSRSLNDIKFPQVSRNHLSIICPLYDESSWKNHEPSHLPSNGLYSITTVLLQGWLWL